MLTVLVVALGNHQRGQSVGLRSELTLTRSSLLYADKVVVLSPWVTLARESYEMRSNINALQIWANLADRPDLRAALVKDESNVAFLLGEIASVVASKQTPLDVEITELVSAEKSGWVETISLMEDSDSSTEETGIAKEQAQESVAPVMSSLSDRFVDQLVGALQDPTVHAVFDSRAGQLIRTLSSEDARLAEPQAVSRSQEAELGSGLIARLPAFPTAPLDELISLKSDLRGPLQRYRGAVASLESQMSGVIAGEHVDAEIQAIWRGTVAPSLVEIEDSLTDHGLVKELARSVATSARDLVISGASLAIAATTVGQVGAAVSAAAGLGGMALQATGKALVERSSGRRKAKQSDFYYLFRLNQAAGRL